MIVTWNSAGVIGPCLDTVADAAPGDAEVVVVDNGSADDTVAIARRHPAAPAVIANPRNRGLAAANNQGFAATAGRLVVVANPDTRPAPGAIRALADLLDRRPRAAIAVPRLRYPDGGLQVSAGDLPSLAEALFGRQAARRRGGASGFWWDGWAHDEERRIGRGHESFYALRREALAGVGPLDERFPLDWEGIDWSARAAAAGWEAWFTPAAEVVHLGGSSIRRAPLRWIAGSHRGMYRYFAKRSGWPWRPPLALLITLRALVKSAAVLLGPAAYERAHRG